jgi:hypothetical protein
VPPGQAHACARIPSPTHLISMWIPATAALLLLGGAAASPRPAPLVPQADTAPKADLSAAFLALEDEYNDAYNAWRRELSTSSAAYRAAAAAAADDAPTKPFVAPERIEPGFFPRFDRLANAGEVRAQIWCLANYVSEADAEAQKRDFTSRTLSVLMNPDSNHGALPRILSSQSRSGTPLTQEDGRALVTLVETMATDAEARSSAAYTLASMAPPAGVDDAAGAGMKLAGMRSLAERYPDTRYGKRAGGFVFQTENLQIGMVAPDILGLDVDGNDMKLSDFRGKVTVIDFWGFW